MAIKTNKQEETQTPEPDYAGHRQRLKARFLSDLGRSMPDYELLELILMYAIPRRDVKPLAKSLLREYVNLANVLSAPPEELMNIHGVGTNAAVLCSIIHASCNKICWENLENKDLPVLTSKQKVVEYCRTRIGYGDREQLLVIYLDIHGRYIRDSIEQVGTIGSVILNARDIINKAMRFKACAVLIAHNHPSGDCTPSMGDIEMTKELKDGLKTVRMQLEDHIIISQRGYYSMRENLPFMRNP
ncbi:MAG: DNA repair protein RadC [Alphaproteobacteria bacterium]|nr:DNA repair protein RadC [Alphaproteobacteria bacterium]MBO5441866.1 DNA repair protein RadC [Alphaproteobacteria bacterium]MBP3687661.1 DNA repair protein RadC [Alphaproteobacteria bacterium]